MDSESTINIVSGIAYVILCKVYNYMIASDDEQIPDLLIVKTLVLAIASLCLGHYVMKHFNDYTPSFTVYNSPPTHLPGPQVASTHPRITRVVPV